MATSIEELMRESIEAFVDADWDRMEPLYWPDAEAKAPEEWPEAEGAQGWAAIRNQFERLKEPWAEDHFEIDSFELPSDDVIFVVGDWHTRGEESGIEVDLKMWVIGVARGEKLSRVEFYLDEAKARGSAALR